MTTEPTKREFAYVWHRARQLGFDLVKTDDGRFAICDRETGCGRYPDSGGITFDEMIIVLRRRAREEW